MKQISPLTRRHNRLGRMARSVAGLGLVAGVAAGAVAGGTGIANAASSTPAPVHYTYSTHNDSADPTFNQLLGINDQQVIAGYFGVGSATHPNKGYTIVPPYAQTNFRSENYPGSLQTQVTGLNDGGTTVGFYQNAAGQQIGFVHTAGGFTSVSDPLTPSSTSSVNQLLGVNNNGVAVGFYNNAAGLSVPYEYNLATKAFKTITGTNAGWSAFASGINDQNEIVGTEIAPNGSGYGWEDVSGKIQNINIRTLLNATNIQVFGVNDLNQIVGFYTDRMNNNHGFVVNHGVPTVLDDPNGVGQTFANGINNGGTIVGFYQDSKGNIDGFVAQPTPF